MKTIIWSPEGTDAVSVRLSMIRGNTFNLYIEVVDRFGAQFNLTGALIWFTLKRYIGDLDTLALIYKKSPSAALSIVDPTAGLIRLKLLPSDTIAFAPWNYLYPWCLQMQLPSGDFMTPLLGTLNVMNDIIEVRP